MKKPKKPTICIFDADSLLFSAAQAGETTWYIYSDENGKEIARFDSAQKGKNWIEAAMFMEYDELHQYTGDFDKLTRTTIYEIGDVKDCYKAFDKGLKKLLKETGCTEMRAYIGKRSGAKVFRYKLATIHEYKKGRSNLRKPHYLEEVRKYARSLDCVTTVNGDIEVDDRVVEVAEKLGDKACLTFYDKDSLQSRGTFLYHIGNHTKPVWSNPNIVGRIGKRDDGKTKKLGYLALLWQMIAGDKQVDGIVGIPGKGDKFAFDLLEPFDNKPLSVLPEAVESVLRVYYGKYGREYTYTHWDGSVSITASYKDMFEENLMLLWMRRFRNDKCEVIMNIVADIEFEDEE